MGKGIGCTTMGLHLGTAVGQSNPEEKKIKYRRPEKDPKNDDVLH